MLIWEKYFIWISLGLIFALEVIIPRTKQSFRKKALGQDLFWFVFIEYFYNWVLLLLRINVIVLVYDLYKFLGIPQLLVQELPIFFQVLIFLISLTFFNYWVHRLYHSTPFLWRFHMLHHSSENLNIFSTYRIHFLTLFLIDFLSFAGVTLIAFDGISIEIAMLVFTVWNLLLHANISLRIPLLSKVFILPQDHYWHHSKTMKHKFGQNFGTIFSFWDRLFGTYYSNDGLTETGVNSDEYPAHALKRLIYPFLKKK